VPTQVGYARERGMSLIELCMALVMLTIGLLAAAQFFPAGSLDWTDPLLTLGRHPAGSTYEVVGSGNNVWQRFYIVSAMPAPLDNLRMINVGVAFNFQGRRDTVTSVTYVRR